MTYKDVKIVFFVSYLLENQIFMLIYLHFSIFLYIFVLIKGIN